MNKEKILIVGYSVTLQSGGYFDHLAETLSDTVELHRYAIGAVNLSTFLYCLNDLNVEKKYDIVILEVSTCYRWLGNNSKRYRNIFEFIICYLSRYVKKIGVLDFSRVDVDPNDVLHSVIREISQEYGLLIRSCTDDIHSLVYDGIHPNSKGIKVYSDIASDLINTLLLTQPHATHLLPNVARQYYFFKNLDAQYFPRFQPIDMSDINGNYQQYTFEKGGVEKKIISISEGEKLTLKFMQPICINGILLKVGPQTGKMVISIKGKQLISTLPYDNRCYYERYMSILFFLDSIITLEISCVREEDRPNLVKGEEWMGMQSIDIGGFFTSIKKLPF